MRLPHSLPAWSTTVLLFTSLPARAFDTGVSVGENVSVDPNMGLMRFTIPLTAPEGFPGVSPELSLRYASASGSGVVGMGWTMTHPTIERMTMRGVPRYDETDLFVADGGNELVRVSDGASPMEPAIYRKRFESDFTRFRWHERQGGRGGYWEAQYADGRRGFFGADAQGRPVPSAVEAGRDGTFKYHLVELLDVHDHRMVMSYVKDGAISLLSEVSYVFTSATPTYRMQLAYEGRSDAVSDAKPGFERRLTQRLSEVRVTTRGRPLRRFALRYQPDAATGRRTRLARVQTFGADGELYPIVHSFDYSRGLGAQCESADCGRPLLVTMVGDQGLGVAFQSGTTNLVDINGDALPDLVDAATTQVRHRFFLNQLGSDGSHGFTAPQTSAVGEVSDFALGNPRVQFIDVNGDGFTDLLRGGAADQRVLINRGAGDWAEALALNGTSAFTGADAELRFMDYDNDMDVDMLRSTDTQTFVFENDGNFEFTGRETERLGVAFSENLQFSDVNGDGLLDVVRLQPNQLQYKLNFGRGRFSPRFETVSHPFGAGEIAQALIEDLDSDGFADIVVVSGNTVRYVLSRSGEAFDPVQSLSQVGGEALPNREITTTVLAADMNGNGSIDIVWVGGTGSVRYLDLFPVRSHLLTRIENGLGRVTDIEYQPSVEQRALSREEGQPWVHPLPYPMVVVSRTDEFDLLTNVSDVVEFRYRDGFYDGLERQFRGYAEVRRRHPGDPSQEEGRTLSRFDVGIVAPHLNGKLLLETRESGGRVIDETTRSYGDDTTCPVAEVPSPAALAQLGRRAVRFPCEIEKVTVVQEGLTPDRWVTTRTTRGYEDGYGNVTREVNEGVVAVGGGACEACTRPSGTFGAPCGSQCLGEESFEETTFVPVSNAGGRWLLGKAARTRRFGTEANADGFFSEEINFYDGEAFEGLSEGQLTKGLLSRQTRRIDDAKVITTERQRFDRHGNPVDRLDPLGTPGGAAHRRTYAYDEDGLRLTRVDLFNEAHGEAYQLRQEMQYDLLFDKVTLATAWMLVEGGGVTTSRDLTAYSYDSFGRVSSILRPGGDSGAAPTVEIAYELGSPTTRLITRRRSEVGGRLDLESIACLDGRGRRFQTRTKTAEGAYTVDGFTVFNLRSEPLRVFQSYTGGAAG
ncbi:MAG: toxin TcdB middle/N-terminal domain-containing protein [Myxococcota bacterium]